MFNKIITIMQMRMPQPKHTKSRKRLTLDQNHQSKKTQMEISQETQWPSSKSSSLISLIQQCYTMNKKTHTWKPISSISTSHDQVQESSRFNFSSFSWYFFAISLRFAQTQIKNLVFFQKSKLEIGAQKIKSA